VIKEIRFGERPKEERLVPVSVITVDGGTIDSAKEPRPQLLRARLFYPGRRPLALWGLMGYN
jgi:hypothetical protein